MAELTAEQKEILEKNLTVLNQQTERGFIFLYDDKNDVQPCFLKSVELDGDTESPEVVVNLEFLFHEDADHSLDYRESLPLDESDFASQFTQEILTGDDTLELDSFDLEPTNKTPAEYLSEEDSLRRLRLDCRTNDDYDRLRTLTHTHGVGPVVDLNLGIAGDAPLVEKVGPRGGDPEYRVDSPVLDWFSGLSRFLFGGELDESTQAVTAKGPDGQEVTLPALETPEDVERAMTPGLMANLLYVNTQRLAARDILESALEASVRCLPEDWAGPESQGFDQPGNRVLERFFNDLASDARDAARDEATNLEDALGQTLDWKPFQKSRFMDAAKEIVVMERFADMARYSPSDGIFSDSIVSMDRDVGDIFVTTLMDDIATQGFFEQESAGIRNAFLREELAFVIRDSLKAQENGMATEGSPVIGEIVERKEYPLAGDMPDTPDGGAIPQEPYQQSYLEHLAEAGEDVSNTARVREEAVEAAYLEAIARTALGENDPPHGVLDSSIQVVDSIPKEAIEQFRSLRPDRQRALEREQELSPDAPGPG